jgi:hypothetical protein
MPDTNSVYTILRSLFPYAWAAAYLFVAVAAFCRLRATASGLLVGVPLVILAVRVVAVNLILHSLKGASSIQPMLLVLVISSAVTLLLLLPVVIGVALLPGSLRRLALRAKPH